MGQFIPVKLNGEKEGRTVAAKYGVRGYPTILFINGAGEIEDKIGGYMPPDGFSQKLREVQQTHQEFPRLQARYKSNPGDMALAQRLLGIYATRGNDAAASAVVANIAQHDPHNAQGKLYPAYYTLGVSQAQRGAFAQAIPVFRKAAAIGKTPKDLIGAHMNIAFCLLNQNKIKEAIPELKAAHDVPGASAADKQQTQAYLERVQQFLQKKGGAH